MRRMTKALLAFMAGLALLVTVAACEDEPPTEKDNQANKNADVYEQLLASQEVSDPTYSNDLANIDLWVDTWGTNPGTIAYVYLLSSDGDYISYLVLDGLPTTKCKNATPTYELLDFTGDGDSYPDMQVPAPGLSGTYSTGSGDCSTMYGKDVSTGAYIEFTVGASMAMIASAAPIPIPEGVEPPAPMGFTTFEDVQ